MPLKKYRDWRGWLDGMRSKVMKATGEAVVAQTAAYTGTNLLKEAGINDVAMTIKVAIVAALSQIFIRVITSAAQYVANKPDPDVVVEEDKP